MTSTGQDDRPAPPPETSVPSRPCWIPTGPDVLDAAPARVHNAALGGMHNFAPDRALWAQIEALDPQARSTVQAGRAFLERATEAVTASGIRQFLDIGAGIPVLGATHETLRDLDTTASVVYVDIDPIAVEQARQLLRRDPRAHAVRGDLLDPHQITDNDAVLALIDFADPVAVILGTILQFIPDDAAAASSISRLADALAPGSLLIITHATPALNPDEQPGQEAAHQLFEQHTPTPAVLRTADQLGALIDDQLTVLPPGIVTTDQWQADPDCWDEPEDPSGQTRSRVLVAVARLRPADGRAQAPMPAKGEPTTDQPDSAVPERTADVGLAPRRLA
ncbi:SAM-dependent methyltransferase [Actinoplanes sp. HUAS TT8]|uniref:SAM-dependent methyltransferase n=1 Tax=Actinoplanes sp. HUAS TT8 TaxID=3447453 RepID=UPI003F51C5B6